MSNNIYHHDQYKLNQIFEQVKTISEVVDELRIALNDLKKAVIDVNCKRLFLESTKENNKIVESTVLRKMKNETYFRNTGTCTKINEMHQLTDNTQAWRCCSASSNYIHYERKRDHKPSAHPIRSLMYDSLKLFKNKIIKNIQSSLKTRRSLGSNEHECVTSNQQQLQMCSLQREKRQKSLKNTRNKDIIKEHNTDISKELINSTDTSFTFDVSVQTEIAIWQENEENLSNFPYQNVIKNTQARPLSMISDDRFMIHSDRLTGDLSKNHAKYMFLTNKRKKYKKCSCKEQCPYALYKLPCNKYKCSTPTKKVADEINGLTFECVSFQRKNNFPRFVNVDTAREKSDRRFADFSPVKFKVNESSTSSLSVDLEVKIHKGYPNSENIDEFSKRRRARTYIVNKKSMRKNDLIKNFEKETEPFFNKISLLRHENEKKKNIDEIIENEQDIFLKEKRDGGR